VHATDDLAGRTDPLIQGIGVLNIERSALPAVRKIEFVVVGDALQEVPCPFETQLRLLVKQQVGLISTAKPMTKFDARTRPTGVYAIMLINANQKPGRKQCYKRRSLNLIL
jgi:hypothetical protein